MKYEDVMDGVSILLVAITEPNELHNQKQVSPWLIAPTLLRMRDKSRFYLANVSSVYKIFHQTDQGAMSEELW